MARCNFCKKSFHACGSCGLIKEEWDYCSDACYKNDGSPTYCYDCEMKAPINKNLLCLNCCEQLIAHITSPKFIVWVGGLDYLAHDAHIMLDGTLHYKDSAGIDRVAEYCDWEVIT